MSIAMGWKKILAAGAIALMGMACGHHASAAEIIYRHLPTNLPDPSVISWHNASGPVIADDFVPVGGGVFRELIITWRGSAPPSNDWELVIQNNNPASGEPDLTPAGNNVTGGIKAFVSNPRMTPTALPGIWRFVAISPTFDEPLAFLSAGQHYWLTVANFAPGWNWAEALDAPTLGSSPFPAQFSTGPLCLDGGPHCGPWNDLGPDFAFQIAVPEPASLALLGTGLVAFGVFRRRRSRQS